LSKLAGTLIPDGVGTYRRYISRDHVRNPAQPRDRRIRNRKRPMTHENKRQVHPQSNGCRRQCEGTNHPPAVLHRLASPSPPARSLQSKPRPALEIPRQRSIRSANAARSTPKRTSQATRLRSKSVPTADDDSGGSRGSVGETAADPPSAIAPPIACGESATRR
jgi:hypothetical protein